MNRYLMNFDLARLPQVHSDVLVIGTGIAGLYTALKVRSGGRVLLLTKRRLEDSNTEFAQGGIAAAIGSADSPRLHLQDTLEAGAGLNDLAAVEVLVEEGPDCVRELIELGTQFDKVEETGEIALTREGAHSQHRILHARGDATGEEIRRALQEKVLTDPSIEVRENHYLVDVLTDPETGRCIGALAIDDAGALTAYLARATVLATGGAGQLYLNSTNPEIATGDGIAVAYRAGAAVADVEFVQFHPTALYHRGSPKFLISEAVRGEGAILLNTQGERFMPAYHPRAELAPRDVVSRAIVDQMTRTGSAYVLLDATGLGAEVKHRFPNIYRVCLKHGIDITRKPIPVAPAAHYMMGGILTDVDGRTTIPGLYACGETACTGIHGANRLASNSLLEGLVFGRRIARHLARELPPLPAALPELAHRAQAPAGSRPVEEMWVQVQECMWREVGISREEAGLARAELLLAELEDQRAGVVGSPAALQLANMITVARLVARAARERQESRGGHYRIDYPQRDDAQWQRRIIQVAHQAEGVENPC